MTAPLEAHSITKRFGKREVLSNVSLALPPGTITVGSDLRTGAWSSPGLGAWFPWRASRLEPTTGPQWDMRLCGPNGKTTRYDARTAEPLSAAPTSVARSSVPSAEELGLDGGAYVGTWAGFGFRVDSRKKEGRGFYDPFRSRFFAQADLFPDGTPWPSSYVRIRPGRWVSLHRRSGSWRLLDPETGHRTPVRFADGWTGPVGMIVRADSATPCDPFGLRVSGPDWSGIARFDPETSTLHRASGSTGEVQLLACTDDDTVLVLEDRRRIVRLRFGGEDRELLFP